MAKTNTYYYDQLNKEQQRAYYAIKEGLLNLKEKRAARELVSCAAPLYNSLF